MVSELRCKDADIQTSSNLGPASKGSYGLSRALDPTLPWEELVDLWVEYPEAVLENPILSLQALTKGEPLHSLLPDLVYASFYIYLSEKGDPEVLQDYIPTERRLRPAGSFRSSWWQYEDLFLHSLDQVSPLFLDKYSRCLAKDPSIEVRQQAAEFLPVHLLSHFLGDSEETVREKLVINLRTQFSTIASCEYHERSLRRHIGEGGHPFIRSLSKTKEDISDIAIRISHDPCEGIRVKNLCSNYASSPLFESAFVNEDESFFIQFVSRCDWLRKTNHQTSSPVSFKLVEQLFSIYPSTLNYMLDEGISSAFLNWKLTQHPDESVSNKAWSLLEFGWGLDEEIVIEDFKTLKKRKFKASWFEKLATKKGIPRFLNKPLWDMGGRVRRALFDNPEPTREKVIAWFKSKKPEELIPLVKKGAHSSVISLAAKHDDFRLRALVAGIPGH